MREIVNYRPDHRTTWLYGGIYRVKKYTKLSLFVLKLLERLGWIKEDGIATNSSHFIRVDLNRDLLRGIRDIAYYYRRETGEHPRKIIVGRKQQLEILKMADIVPRYLNVPLDGSNVEELFGMELELNPFIDGIVVTK